MDILRLFYHQNTAKTNPIIIQQILFCDVLPHQLKISSIYLQLQLTLMIFFIKLSF